MSPHVLRLGAIEEIKRNLNRGFLTFHSFDLQANNADGTLVHISFRDNIDYVFELLRPKSDVNPGAKWRTSESPGRYFAGTESYEHEQFNQAYSALYGWVDRVNEEVVLAAKSHIDGSLLAELRRNVEATADALPEPDKPFSRDELEDWSEQLKKLVARLRELEQKSEIQAGRVEQLTRELEQLKQQGTNIPKKTWLKTAGNKVLDLLDTASKEALKQLAEGAVKAMLEHKP